ncbi:nucleotidyltransferase domain-containing protein, partial [candidate division CSSED10-310 bacterium]
MWEGRIRENPRHPRAITNEPRIKDQPKTMNHKKHPIAKRPPLSDPALEKLVTILRAYDPDQIILFGSRARGEADQYSDYDIIIKQTVRPFLDRLKDMVPYLVQFDHPAEILVYTPEEFDKMTEIGLGWTVHQEGELLYERFSD